MTIKTDNYNQTKNKIYWSCQLIGWGFISIVNFILQTFKADFNLLEELFSAFLFISCGILLSNLLRFIYKKLSIIDLTPLKMIIPVFGLSLLSTILMIFCVFSLLTCYFWIVANPSELFEINLFIGNMIAIYPMMLLWSVLYLAINYLMRWRQSEIDKLSLESALKDAQLNTLMGQVNPHFMFNCLNNIRSLMLEDVDKSRDMLTLLSNVLRYSLTAHKNTFIALGEELKIVEDYIGLSKIQLEDRLNYQRNIKVDSDEILVPPMIIQMLIENAIKHGISEVKGGGILDLTITQDTNNHKLLIKTTNPGSLNTPSSTMTNTGIGLENISKRLDLLYNGRAQFNIDENNGMVITSIEIPLNY